MPIYEYQCASCRKKTEFIQSFSDPHPVKCPACGGTLKKLLSSPTAHFKGSGFHATDYGRTGGKEDSSKGKEWEGGASSEGGAGTQGDSAGDSSKEKKDSRDSSKEKSGSAPGAASEGAAAKTSTAPDSPSKKSSRTK